MLTSKDDFRAAVTAALEAAAALCLDSESDRKLATDLIIAALYREMARHSDPEKGVAIENEAMKQLHRLNIKESSPLTRLIVDLVQECARLRKAEHEMRQIACYTMRKRIEHEEECPVYDDHQDADDNDA